MPQLTRPTRAETAALLRAQSALDFTYPDVGAIRDTPPSGWTVDHHRARLGSGRDTLDRARRALRGWRQFDLGWVELDPVDAPIEPGQAIAVVARGMSLWWSNAARIVYVIDEPDRFEFGYGTLPHHIARGEERFRIERDPVDDSVWYDVLAFSRPHTLAARIGYPFVRRYQHRFAEHSMEAMGRAVGAGAAADPALPTV